MSRLLSSKVASGIFVLVVALSAQHALAADVRIATASNFTATMQLLARAFEQQTGYKTLVSYGSTGKLFAQIHHGAPFDVFLAADTLRPQKAIEQGLAEANSLFIYATGRLLLCGNGKDFSKQAINWLSRGEFRRLAIANQRTAPYGTAARQVLEKLGLWDSLDTRIIQGDSIAQTFQFVATGNAEAGFIAASQAQRWPAFRQCWQVPGNLHQPLRQAAVLLKRGTSNPAARAFMAFLQQETTRQIIREQGYDAG